jgi:hypothetical protein
VHLLFRKVAVAAVPWTCHEEEKRPKREMSQFLYETGIIANQRKPTQTNAT